MALSLEERERFIFLEEHSELDHHWLVEGFDPGFFRHFEGVIGTKRVLTPFGFPAFQERAEAEGLRLVFVDDPTPEFDWAASLMEEPDVRINSDLAGTPSGMLPFQVQGYNFLKHVKGGIANWSTGTGKTVVSAALTRFHYDQGNFDLCLWVVKPHNKINTQRALQAFVGLDAMVVDGTPTKRQKTYDLTAELLTECAMPILIVNYEKFRDDEDNLQALVENKRVFIVWDEMPTKLKNRGTQMYKAVCRTLYLSAPRTVKGRERPADLRQLMLSATPIENSPEDFFSCVRLIDPDIYGTAKEFHYQFVRTWSPFQYGVPLSWKNLATMGAKATPITHQVDKNDPDIAAQFPEVIEETIYVDMTDKQQKIYNRLMKVIMEDGTRNDLTANMMSKIGVAQMLVDHPLAVLRSATNRAAFEAELEAGGFPAKEGSELAMKLRDAVGDQAFGVAGSAKFDGLEDILESMSEGDKTIIFTAFNASMIPLLSEALTTWGYNHVTYTGEMSTKQKQESEDRFKTDPDCAIFLSSDSGSDSINLEVASMVIHFDLPWKWSTVIQRQNRAHRITSSHEKIRYYALLAANSVEARKQEVIAAKAGYHDAIFKGAISDQSEDMRLTNKDLLYILTGKS